MRLWLNRNEIVVEKWKSKDILLRILDKHDSDHILLGNETIEESIFYTIKIRQGVSGKKRMIGLMIEGGCLEPQLFLDYKNNNIIIGYNSKVAFISATSLELLGKFDVVFMFRGFLATNDPNVILSINELGIAAFSLDVKKLWERDKELVLSYELQGDNIKVEYDDNTSQTMDIYTGKLV